MTKKSPPEITTVDELVAKSVFEKEFAKLKKDLENQQSITWQVVVGVAFAFIFAVGIIVVETNLARDSDSSETVQVEKEINSQNIQINNLSNEIDNLKIRNPYLK